MNENRIQSVELAWEMAYAEKPYQDMAIEGMKSEIEKVRLNELANIVGVAAARGYINNLNASIDPFDSPIEAVELPGEFQNNPLDTKLEEETIKLLSVRAYNCLKRDGIDDARGILIAGKNRIRNTPNLGKKSMAEIEEWLVAHLGEDTKWLESPTVEDIASWCETLSQVPAYKLPFDWQREDGGKLYVQEVLDLPIERLKLLFAGKKVFDYEIGRLVDEPDEIIQEKAESFKREATIFAINFSNAKARQTQQN